MFVRHKNFHLRRKQSQRGVHLCNIHQLWILMSDLTEKGKGSTLLRNGDKGKKNTDVSDRPCQAKNFLVQQCRCEQTLTRMSDCQSEARRKSLLQCSCVQLSPWKNDIYLTPRGVGEEPKETGLRGDLNTKYKWKHWGSTLIYQPEVKQICL